MNTLLYWIDKVSRCVTRTTTVAAVAVYVITVAFIVFDPSPRCLGFSVQREIYGVFQGLAALTSLFSIAASLPAVIIFASGRVWKHHTIHRYIAVSMITLLLVFMTPVW